MADDLSPEQKAAKDLADKALKDAADAAGKTAADTVMAGMKDSIGAQVQDALGQFVRDNAPQAPAPEQDPIAKLVSPLVNPALARANVMAEAARDQALFFQLNPDALEHRDAILGNWQEMLNKGVPLKMEVIWNEYRGKNFAKFHESASKKDTEKVNAAKEAEGVGPGSPDRGEGSKVLKDPYAASDADLTKALENVAF